jgi:two-component sensor histidine kinase
VPDQSERPELPAELAAEYALRDANHRLKNALHLVASLLNLQRGRLGDDAVVHQFDAAIERIAVLGQVYGGLPPDGGPIAVAPLIESICHDLGALAAIPVTVDTVEATLPLTRAIGLGLIVHELVANAVRHGFPDGRAGTVSVRLTPGGALAIDDDGVGYDGVAEGFGLALVHIMVGQVQGRLTRAEGPGTRWRLTF